MAGQNHIDRNKIIKYGRGQAEKAGGDHQEGD